MATKQEIFDTVSNEVTELCVKYQVSKKVTEGLAAIMETNLKPKAGGASVNIEEVTVSVDGKITEIQCSVSGVFLPATKAFFYEDKAGKGINGLKRLSRQAESVRKTYIKTLAATEKAIMADVLDKQLTPELGKAKLDKAKAIKPDYSKVTAELPKDEPAGTKDEPTGTK